MKKEFFRTLKFVLFSASAGIIQVASFTLLNELLDIRYSVSYLISLVLSVLWNFTFNRKFNKEVELSIHKLRPHWQTMKEIYRIGIPSIVLQSVGAVMNWTKADVSRKPGASQRPKSAPMADSRAAIIITWNDVP